MSTPTIDSVTKEIRLSAWLFGIFAAICILVALASYVFAGRVEDGWIVGACISIAGWALVVHFAKHLDKASTNVRSNL